MSADQESSEQRSSGRWLVATGVVVVVGVLLLMPVRYPGRILGIVFDFAHVPVFAVFVYVVIRLVCGCEPSWKVAAAIAIVAAAFGLGGEYLQGYVGRSGDWGDAASNAVGAAIGFVVGTWRKWRRGLLWGAGLALSAALVAVYFNPALTLTDLVRQHTELPLLASFESELELTRWRSGLSKLSRSTDHVSDGRYSLKWQMNPGPYPQCTLIWPVNDWTPYRALEFDVWNDADEPLEIVTKIEDFRHNKTYADRFHQPVRVPKGKTTVRVDLKAVQDAPDDRKMDMALITRLSLFTIDLRRQRVLHIDRVKLIR
jgi:hypothetical protein